MTDHSPHSNPAKDNQYLLIEQAIIYLADHQKEQPGLKELAQHLNLSESYVQKVFTHWVGISPKRFLQFLSKEYIKGLLNAGQDKQLSCLNAGYQAGLSSGSRVHELFISTEAMTPAQYKTMGRNLNIYYGFHHSPFGEYLIAVSEKGICQLHFLQDDRQTIEAAFKNEWALANIEYNVAKTLPFHQKIFTAEVKAKPKLTLLLKGTNFQIQVWQALLSIPFGGASHYACLAESINKPKATRAAASAIAKNNIAYLIPCHRVIRKIGLSGEYRWGSKRKEIMLAYEGALKSSKVVRTKMN